MPFSRQVFKVWARRGTIAAACAERSLAPSATKSFCMSTTTITVFAGSMSSHWYGIRHFLLFDRLQACTIGEVASWLGVPIVGPSLPSDDAGVRLPGRFVCEQCPNADDPRDRSGCQAG